VLFALPGLLRTVAWSCALLACGRSGFDPDELTDGAPDDVAEDVSARYAADVLSAGPLAYWRFDDITAPTAHDASGNGHHGTYAAVTLGKPGVLGGNAAAEIVDTNGAGVDMGDVFGFEGNVPFTVELWVSPTEPEAVLVGKFAHDGTGYDGWHLHYYPTATTLRRARLNMDAPPIPLGQYSYVVATYDGVTATVYVNGVAGTPRVASAAVPVVPAPFLVGNQVMGQWARHVGLVDELAVYDRALSAAEIEARYRLVMP
jgi:hypothetical protein